MRLILGSKFTYQNRLFEVKSMVWFGGKCIAVDIMEIFKEPEPTQLHRKSYDYLMDLAQKKVIVIWS